MAKFLYAALMAGFAVQFLPSASQVLAADPKADVLQGNWTLVSTEEDGKVKSALADPFTLVVSGNTARLGHGEQVMWEAAVKRQPTDKAGLVKFDLAYNRTKGKAAPPAEDGSAYGLLQVRGDELKFSVSHGSDDGERPTDFVTAGKAGAGRTVFTWHRAAEKAAPAKPVLGIKLPAKMP